MVQPLESTDPILAENIRQIVRGEHPTVQTLYFNPGGFMLCKKDGSRIIRRLAGRNDLCPCGSKLKFKRCCGK